MKNIKTLFFVLLLLSCFSVQAQRKMRQFPNVTEMHEHKWKAITGQVKLTPEEMSAVKPIFLEYEQAVWKIHQERRDAIMDFNKNKRKADIDYNSLNNKYVNFEIKQALLLRAYHLRLKKILKPETLFNYYRAERMFKRKLLRNMPPPPPDEKEEN